jgi:UDP-glucuronate decarboxylase
LIEGFLKLVQTGFDVTGPVNLGNPREFTMLELATKIIELTDSQSVLEFQPLPFDDPKQRKPDISIAKSELNWEPKIELEEGLALTIRDFKTRIGAS